MTTLTADTPELEQAAQALEPLIRAEADASEQQRALTAPLVRALREAGLYRLYVARSLGGLEVGPLTAMRVVEALAYADGSTGWCVMIAAQAAHQSGRLNGQAAAEVFATPEVIMAGVPRTDGEASVVDGGYRVTGQWPFCSGSRQATWFIVGARQLRGETPVLDAAGSPVTTGFFLRAADVEVLDTWHTTGLRATGSNDIAVRDLFVPAHRAFNLWVEPPTEPGPLYRYNGVVFLLHGAHALGLARRALDEFARMAVVKQPRFSSALLRDRADVQQGIGEARATVAAAWAYLEAVTRDFWEVVTRGETPSWEQRAALRLATGHAAQCARHAVALVCDLAGTTAIFQGSALERIQRDMLTAATHVVVGPRQYVMGGRLALGVPLDTQMQITI